MLSTPAHENHSSKNRNVWSEFQYTSLCESSECTALYNTFTDNVCFLHVSVMRIIYNHSIFNGILYNRLETAFSSLLVLTEQSSLQNISFKNIFIFTGHSRRMEGLDSESSENSCNTHSLRDCWCFLQGFIYTLSPNIWLDPMSDSKNNQDAGIDIYILISKQFESAALQVIVLCFQSLRG